MDWISLWRCRGLLERQVSGWQSTNCKLAPFLELPLVPFAGATVCTLNRLSASREIRPLDGRLTRRPYMLYDVAQCGTICSLMQMLRLCSKVEIWPPAQHEKRGQQSHISSVVGGGASSLGEKQRCPDLASHPCPMDQALSLGSVVKLSKVKFLKKILLSFKT